MEKVRPVVETSDIFKEEVKKLFAKAVECQSKFREANSVLQAFIRSYALGKDLVGNYQLDENFNFIPVAKDEQATKTESEKE